MGNLAYFPNANGGLEMEIGIQTEIVQGKLGKQEKWALFILIGLMLIAALFVPKLQGLMSIAPIIYFFVEGGIRKRSRSDVGLSFAGFSDHLKKNWYLILLVGILMQSFYVMMYNQFFTEVIKHVMERVPLNLSDISVSLILSIVILAFGEEIGFRGLIQAKLNKMMPTTLSILLTSLLFALMHLKSGPVNVVIPDLFSVFLDSILFGIIFARTKNIFISTIAHILANLFAILSIHLFVM